MESFGLNPIPPSNFLLLVNLVVFLNCFLRRLHFLRSFISVSHVISIVLYSKIASFIYVFVAKYKHVMFKEKVLKCEVPMT